MVLYITHPVSPMVDILLLNILLQRGIFVTIEESTMVHYSELNSRIYSDVTSFSTNVLLEFQVLIQGTRLFIRY